MSGEAHTTTDHELIRQWAERRGAQPAAVEGTGSGDDPGILRIQFPDSPKDENLTRISWDEFFRKFEKEGLAFVYQDTLKDGKISRFSKLVSRDSDR